MVDPALCRGVHKLVFFGHLRRNMNNGRAIEAVSKMCRAVD